jgi:hypothetical protein
MLNDMTRDEMKKQTIIGMFDATDDDKALTLNSAKFEKQAIGDGAFIMVKKEEEIAPLDVNRYSAFRGTWTKPAAA